MKRRGCCCGEEKKMLEDMTLLHIISHRPGLSNNPLYTGFLCMACTNTAVHLTGKIDCQPMDNMKKFMLWQLWVN